MDQKIHNPYNNLPGYNCFGCASNNKMGLRLEFYESGDELFAKWIPQPQFAGYLDTLHGGIQATLLDEIASWIIQVKLHVAGVTSSLKIKYRKPVHIHGEALTLKAQIKEQRRNLVIVDTSIMNSDMEVCSEASITYFTFSKERSIKELHFPENPKIFYK